VFEPVEAATLVPLPDKPFVLARWSPATVGPDIHIKVGRHPLTPTAGCWP
jgi:hypothetical protein